MGAAKIRVGKLAMKSLPARDGDKQLQIRIGALEPSLESQCREQGYNRLGRKK